LIGSLGSVIEERRSPKLVTGYQFGENLAFGNAWSQGLERRSNFQFASLIKLRVRIHHERCHYNKCRGDEKGCGLETRVCHVSSPHVWFLLFNLRS
jgi:hypothetical protein